MAGPRRGGRGATRSRHLAAVSPPPGLQRRRRPASKSVLPNCEETRQQEEPDNPVARSQVASRHHSLERTQGLQLPRQSEPPPQQADQPCEQQPNPPIEAPQEQTAPAEPPPPQQPDLPQQREPPQQVHPPPEVYARGVPLIPLVFSPNVPDHIPRYLHMVQPNTSFPPNPVAWSYSVPLPTGNSPCMPSASMRTTPYLPQPALNRGPHSISPPPQAAIHSGPPYMSPPPQGFMNAAASMSSLPEAGFNSGAPYMLSLPQGGLPYMSLPPQAAINSGSYTSPAPPPLPMNTGPYMSPTRGGSYTSLPPAPVPYASIAPQEKGPVSRIYIRTSPLGHSVPVDGAYWENAKPVIPQRCVGGSGVRSQIGPRIVDSGRLPQPVIQAGWMSPPSSCRRPEHVEYPCPPLQFVYSSPPSDDGGGGDTRLERESDSAAVRFMFQQEIPSCSPDPPPRPSIQPAGGLRHSPWGNPQVVTGRTPVYPQEPPTPPSWEAPPPRLQQVPPPIPGEDRILRLTPRGEAIAWASAQALAEMGVEEWGDMTVPAPPIVPRDRVAMAMYAQNIDRFLTAQETVLHEKAYVQNLPAHKQSAFMIRRKELLDVARGQPPPRPPPELIAPEQQQPDPHAQDIRQDPEFLLKALWNRLLAQPRVSSETNNNNNNSLLTCWRKDTQPDRN